jgi:hypothetical protein
MKPGIPNDNSVDRWTLILPIQLLKSLAKELYSSEHDVPAFEQALRDFIRVFCSDYDEDEVNSIGQIFRSYMEFLRKASKEFDGFSPSIAVIKCDLTRDPILRTMAGTDINGRRETVLGLEMPFEEPIVLEMELLPSYL